MLILDEHARTLDPQSRRIWEALKATLLRGKDSPYMSHEQRRDTHKTVLEIDLKLREEREV